MSFKEIQIALDTHLNLLNTGGVPIAWENTKYKPILGQPFLRPTVLNTSSFLECLDSQQANPGIYRVDAFYPVDNGSKNILEILDSIYAHFKAVLQLFVNNTIILIRAISILPRNISETSWLMGSIDINFINYDDMTSIAPSPGQDMWTPISTSGTVIFGSRYITTNDVSRVVFDLPALCNRGDYFRIAGYGLGGWEINAPPGITIIYGDQQTSDGGTLASVNPHDCIEVVCVEQNSTFEELSSQGNITVT